MRISEAELANDVRAVLEKIRMGAEVIIEREDHSAMAVMRKLGPAGRKVSECIEVLNAREADNGGHAAEPNVKFAEDVDAAVAAHPEPLKPPSWG